MEIRLLAAATLLVALGGCDVDIQRAEVPGKYVAHHGIGEEYVDIRADSTYIHYYKSPDSSELVDTARWVYSEDWESGDRSLVFMDFYVRVPEWKLLGHDTLKFDPNELYFMHKYKTGLQEERFHLWRSLTGRLSLYQYVDARDLDWTKEK